jgi:hypothetical protein
MYDDEKAAETTEAGDDVEDSYSEWWKRQLFAQVSLKINSTDVIMLLIDSDNLNNTCSPR